MSEIGLVLGDITAQDVEVIVNAANPTLQGGGGVDGAIHRAAGPQLGLACRKAAKDYPSGFPVGKALATPGFRLCASWVIHTVGPNAHRGQTNPDDLAACFANCLLLAQEMAVKSIAFPAISAGAYGWNAADVARIAIATVRAQLPSNPSINLVRFVLLSPTIYAIFEHELNQT